MSNQTALYSRHLALGARMVDFHGWLMPLNYGSQLAEHQAASLDGPAQDAEEFRHFERLLQVIVGAKLGGLDGRLDGAVSSYNFV